MLKNKFMAANIDPEEIAGLLRDCADKYILPRYNNLKPENISTKSNPQDLVTIADRETEEALERELLARFPGSVIIGEEGISAGKSSTASLLDDDLIVWIIDPVDGTWNFAHGGEHFGLMLACVHGGETKLGWIYDIPGRRMLIAENGAGAFLDGKRLQVAPSKPLHEIQGFAAFEFFPKRQRPDLEEFKAKIKDVRTLRCSAHEYLRVASGQADFIVYKNMKPWDHLAGTLAVRESGGCVLKWDGTPYRPSDEKGGLVIASDETLAHMIRNVLVNSPGTDYKNNPERT